MARYVIFPGTAGSYADTDDINELDADTAHTFQSIGTWAGTVNASLALVTDAAAFSGTALKVTSIANGGQIVDTGEVPAITGDTRSITVTLDLSTAQDVRFDLAWVDNNVVVQTSTDDAVSLPIGVSVLTLTGTSSVAGIDGCFVRIRFDRNNITLAGDVSNVYDNGMRVGTVATFIPSLRIVGDLETSFKASSRNLSTTPTIYDMGFDPVGTWRVQGLPSGAVRFSLSGVGNLESAAAAMVDNIVDEYKFTYVSSTGAWLWTKAGVSIGSGTTSTDALSGAPLQFGVFTVGIQANGASLPNDGDMYTVTSRDGIDGPIVAIFDAEDIGL